MISVVIPALNEEASVGETVRNVTLALEGAQLTPFEIVVVDDGSKDDTGAVAGKAGARVITHPHNLGYGKSLKDGIEAARYDTIIITDSDGSYPVQEIPRLHARFIQGFDMVVGAREGEHYRESSIKRPLRAILRFLVEWTTARKIPDINSGLRIFRKSTAMTYFPHLCDTFSFTTSLTLSFMMNNRFVAYEPIPYLARVGRTHVRLWRDSILTLQYIVEAVVYYNPLKIFILTSLLCLALSAIFYVLALIFRLMSFFLLGTGTALMSIVVFCIGLVAVLLKQIMNKR